MSWSMGGPRTLRWSAAPTLSGSYLSADAARAVCPMLVGANPGPRADDRPPEGDPQPRRARRSRAGDTMTSSSAQLCRGCVGGPRLTAAHRKHLGRSSRPARIALSGRGRRELRIERRDSAVFRSGGRPVYRKAGRLTPPPLSRSGSSEGRTTGFIGRIAC